MPDRRTHAARKRTRYPADKKKGELEKGNFNERYGHAREAASEEPTGGERTHGASDVGQDASSGGEFLDMDPTRFPRPDEEE